MASTNGDHHKPSWLSSLVQEMKQELTNDIRLMIASQNLQASQTLTSSQTLDASAETSTESQVIHSGVICDNCEKDLVGIRYKCGNCVDYDLCAECESQAESIHNPSHVFLKIKHRTKFVGRDTEGNRMPVVKYNIYSEYDAPMISTTGEVRSSESKSACENCNVEHVRCAVRKLEKLKKKDERLREKSAKIKAEEEKIQRQLQIRAFSASADQRTQPQNKPPVSSHLGGKRSHKPRYSCDVKESSYSPYDVKAQVGEIVSVSWLVENSGNVSWTKNIKVVSMKGPIKTLKSVIIPYLAPTETGVVTLEFKAPQDSGYYTCVWKLCVGEKVFGRRLKLSLAVRDISINDEIQSNGSIALIDLPSSSSYGYVEDEPVSQSPLPLPLILLGPETVTKQGYKPLIESLTNEVPAQTNANVVNISDTPLGIFGDGFDRATPIVSQTTTPYNTPMVMTPPKSPEPEARLVKVNSILDILSEEDSDVEDFSFIGSSLRSRSKQGNDDDVISVTSTSDEDDISSLVRKVPAGGYDDDDDTDEFEDDFILIPEVPSCFNLNKPLSESVIEMKEIERRQEEGGEGGSGEEDEEKIKEPEAAAAAPEKSPSLNNADESFEEACPAPKAMRVAEVRVVDVATPVVAYQTVSTVKAPAISKDDGVLPTASAPPEPNTQAEEVANHWEQKIKRAVSVTSLTNSTSSLGSQSNKDDTDQAASNDAEEVSMLPDSLEDMAEYAISKVMAAGAGVAKNVMNFLKDMDEYQPPQSEWKPNPDSWVPKPDGWVPHVDEWTPSGSDTDQAYPLPTNKYSPKPNQWTPKPDTYVPKGNKWTPRSNSWAPQQAGATSLPLMRRAPPSAPVLDESKMAEVKIISDLERVKTKLTRMGFDVTPRIEQMIRQRLDMRQDLTIIISGITAELLKE